MKCKKMVSVLLSVIMIVFSVPAQTFADTSEDSFAYTVLSNGTAGISGYSDGDTDIPFPDEDTSGDSFTYTVLSDGIAEISGYTGSDTNIMIPEVIDGYTVSSIGERAFQYKSQITSVSIPDTVTNIGDYGFSFCSKLLRIEGGDGILNIGNQAFYGCHSLSDIPVFDQIQTIGGYAFYGTAISSFTIPACCKSIGNNPFVDTKMLSYVNVDENNPYYCSIDGIIYNKILTKVFAAPGGIVKCVLPKTVTNVAPSAFSRCRNLSVLKNAENIINIGVDAFDSCEKLPSIDIFKNVQIIGDRAFESCYGLKEVSIPRTVTSLGNGAFEMCYYVESVYIPSNIKNIPDEAFIDCIRIKKIVIEEGVVSIGRQSFYNLISLKSISLPSTLTAIGNSAIISGLKSVFIPKNVTKIGSHAIGYKLVNLKDVLVSDCVIYGYSDSTAQTYAGNQGLKFYDVETLFDNVDMGGSIRLSSPSGLRFGFRIDEKEVSLATLRQTENVEMGFIYTYSDDTSSLNLEAAGKNGIKKKTALNYIAHGGYTTYNLVFTDIPESEYETKISARAYLKIWDHVYYSQAVTRSAHDVAAAVVNDDEIDDSLKLQVKEIFDL